MSTPAIICVDDDLGILSSLEEQLSRHFGDECDIELASDATEALDLCAELLAEGIHIPVVISDQQMPGMQGDELLVRIHDLTPKALTILLTGQIDRKRIIVTQTENCRVSGCDKISKAIAYRSDDQRRW
ncbi:MAG: response regulator, partial [Cyanobacteria bacterium J06555_12]